MALYGTIVAFLLSEGLIGSHKLNDAKNLESLKLNLSDLTPEGQAFVMSKAINRWLAAFDRNPSKDSSDTKSLVKGLRLLREG